MPPIIAEVISIGDELTSGFRLDTNSQWLSQRLGDLGITVMYHSTVGDDQRANVSVFSTAAARSDVVVCTGGLGPTADDLTRQCLAEMAGVELELNPEQLEHLKTFFAKRGRTMTPTNEIQAHFPAGAIVIPNPEGTAPGIELTVKADQRASVFFALPGVPAEMKQMFAATVSVRLRQITGEKLVQHHHVVRCFGSGESHIESLLPDFVARGRDPLVGITASAGTISLRLTTKAESVDQCLEKMQPTLNTIKEILCDLVFGINDDTLQSVVSEQMRQAQIGLAIEDHGLHGDVAALLSKSAGNVRAVTRSNSMDNGLGMNLADVTRAARETQDFFKQAWGLAIGSLARNVDSGVEEFTIALVDSQDSVFTDTFSYRGHSATRQSIACKRVLNFLRLHLPNDVSSTLKESDNDEK